MRSDETSDLEQRLWVFVLSKLVESDRGESWTRAQAIWKKLIEGELEEVEKRLGAKLDERDKRFLATIDKRLAGVGSEGSSAPAGRRPLASINDRGGGGNGQFAWGAMFGLIIGLAVASTAAYLLAPKAPAPATVATSSDPALRGPTTPETPPPVDAAAADAKLVEDGWRALLAKQFKPTAPLTGDMINPLLCGATAMCTYADGKTQKAGLPVALQAAMDMVRDKAKCEGPEIPKDNLIGPGSIKRFGEVAACAAKHCPDAVCKLPPYDKESEDGQRKLLEAALRLVATPN